MKKVTKQSLKRRVKQLERDNRKLDNRLRLVEAIVSTETTPEQPGEGGEHTHVETPGGTDVTVETPAEVPAGGDDDAEEGDE